VLVVDEQIISAANATLAEMKTTTDTAIDESFAARIIDPP
jgi:hypothetical protein